MAPVTTAPLLSSTTRRTRMTLRCIVIGVVAPLPEVKSVETVLVLDEVLQRPYLLPTDLTAREEGVAEMGLMRFTHTNPNRPGRG